LYFTTKSFKKSESNRQPVGSEVSLRRGYAKVCGEDKENDDEINEIKGGEAGRKREMMR
jgi:hypothetical protein